MTVLSWLNEAVDRVDKRPWSIVKKSDYWLVYHYGWWVNDGDQFRTLLLAVEWILRYGDNYSQMDCMRRGIPLGEPAEDGE